MAENETAETVTTETVTAVAEAVPAQATVTATETKQAEFKPERPFDAQMFGHVVKLYQNEVAQALSESPHLKEALGVTALECENARLKAVQLGLTEEEAAALPGKTAADITAAAKITSGIIAKRLEAAKSDFAKQEPAATPFYRLPSEAEAAKETDPVKLAQNEYARIMGQ